MQKDPNRAITHCYADFKGVQTEHRQMKYNWVPLDTLPNLIWKEATRCHMDAKGEELLVTTNKVT